MNGRIVMIGLGMLIGMLITGCSGNTSTCALDDAPKTTAKGLPEGGFIWSTDMACASVGNWEKRQRAPCHNVPLSSTAGLLAIEVHGCELTNEEDATIEMRCAWKTIRRSHNWEPGVVDIGQAHLSCAREWRYGDKFGTLSGCQFSFKAKYKAQTKAVVAVVAANKYSEEQEQEPVKEETLLTKIAAAAILVVAIPVLGFLLAAALPVMAVLGGVMMAMGTLGMLFGGDDDGPSGTCTGGWSD
jgi:hypothetical protein